jgi:intein-encoded DNA endonuclease-like protein
LCDVMKPVNIPAELTTDVSYLAGIISGDGTLTKYFIKISDGSEVNVRFLEKLTKEIFRINSHVRQESDNKWTIEFDSRILVKYFNERFEIPIGNKSESVSVPEVIKSSDLDVRISYIQGWIDAEGYLENWKKPHTDKSYRRINFCTKSRDVIDWIAKEVKDLGIEVSNVWYSSKVFRFQIARKDSVCRFIKDVGFRYPTKVGGLPTAEG